jgi:hypothetical protein
MIIYNLYLQTNISKAVTGMESDVQTNLTPISETSQTPRQVAFLLQTLSQNTGALNEK